MALIFGSGEPVSRLRRGLDVKGKVNLGLDEIIVPVVTTLDVTQAPYRRSPVRWWAAAIIAAVAGERAQFRIFQQNTVDQLITGCWCRTSASESLTIGQGLPGVAGGIPARTTEIVNADNGAVVSRQVNIQSDADTAIATAISNAFLIVQTSTAESIYYPLDLVLPAMPDPQDPITNAPAILFEIGGSNVTAVFTVTGLYFDAVPLDFRT